MCREEQHQNNTFSSVFTEREACCGNILLSGHVMFKHSLGVVSVLVLRLPRLHVEDTAVEDGKVINIDQFQQFNNNYPNSRQGFQHSGHNKDITAFLGCVMMNGQCTWCSMRAWHSVIPNESQSFDASKINISFHIGQILGPVRLYSRMESYSIWESTTVFWVAKSTFKW